MAGNWSDQQIQDIVKRVRNGESYAELAREYGVTRNVITNLYHRSIGSNDFSDLETREILERYEERHETFGAIAARMCRTSIEVEKHYRETIADEKAVV